MFEFWRAPLLIAGGIVLLALVAWLAFDATIALAFCVLALGLWLAFQLFHLAALIRWLKNPDQQEVPEATGTWDDVFATLYQLLRHSQRSQEHLSQRLERFRQAGAAIPDGFMILNQEGRIEWCNPTAERQLGISLETDQGQHIAYLVRQPDFAAYLEAQDYRNPLRLKGTANPDTVLSVQLVPYGDDQKLILSRDISRWEKIETMRRDFIANVSHELRTPITVIAGFLETLSDSETIDPRIMRRALTLMTEQTQRMQRLIEDLLTLTKLEISTSPLKEKRVNMDVLLRSLLHDAQHLSRDRHEITLREEAAVDVLGNEDELLSAFGNLVSNAIRYTPEGGQVTLAWTIEQGEGVFSVRDSGIGIPPEHIPRLTERFYRVDRSRSRETGGTGLGLAIVKHVLQRHQARLTIDSQENEGSCFACRFPANRLLSSAITAESAQA